LPGTDKAYNERHLVMNAMIQWIQQIHLLVAAAKARAMEDRQNDMLQGLFRTNSGPVQALYNTIIVNNCQQLEYYVMRLQTISEDLLFPPGPLQNLEDLHVFNDLRLQG